MRSSAGLPAVEASGLSECLDRLAATKGGNRPLSTYRLQFHRGFRFVDARRLAPYLHALGISHCYASPILKSRPGSLHGYDITDHSQINPEIGTEEEFQEFVRELKAAGMGLVLDIVPNHMGVGQGTNPWWQDLLENGQASRYAEFFDIDWRPLKNELHGKVLLPMLGDQYGDELERGNLVLHFEDGAFFCSYYEKHLPIDPQTVPLAFEPLGDLRIRQPEDEWQSSGMAELEELLGEMRNLPPHTCDDLDLVEHRQEAIPRIKGQMKKLAVRSPQVRHVIEEAVARANGRPGDHHSFDTLHRLLNAQAYRLAHWRVSGEEINYRRFFDINELVGLRMENGEVFAATHRLIRRLLAEGSVQGIRIDHPDGLYNPVQYFARLQILYAAGQCCGPEPAPMPLAENGIEAEVQIVFGQHDWLNQRPPMYVLVEKILEPGEDLPQQWPVDGTVGYDFGNLVNGIFIETRNQRLFTMLYHRFIGGPVDIDTIIYNAKRLIMRVSLASEVTVLTHMLEEISSTDRHARDFTRHSLFEAIRETIASFPVYRTYIDARGHISDADRGYIESAIRLAKRRNEGMSAAVFDFLRHILLLRSSDGLVSAENYRKRLRFALKFQQLTGPVMAKGLEDTACYVYNRLITVNEVGGSPKEFGIAVDEFHAGNQQRAHRWPNSMLSTSTHDSKRSEDVRARINVLSEMPRPWAAQVMRWRRANRNRRRALNDGRAVPDANEEYLLYQTLVGAWPLRPPQSGQQRPWETPATIGDRAEREEFTRRIQQYMVKAVHEAKVNLSWTSQNPEYVAALEQFIARILQPGTPARPNPFLGYLEAFVPRVAFFGCINSLGQTVLKLTCPGMPDLYQGTELWDFSLVDPDNRRPVDYELRQRLLGDLLVGQGGEPPQPAKTGLAGDAGEPPQQAKTGLAGDPGDLISLCDQLLENYADGRIKMWTTLRALNLRRDHPELFQSGGYVPLSGNGERAEHLVAFAREHNWQMAITALPRLPYTLSGGEPGALPGRWGDTLLALPSNAPGEFVNVFTGERLRASNGALLCRELFAHFPVALLLGD
jgi:(1->4)-alpha-D-glucan 1-alpha-D-glucosylmutase